MLLELEEVSKKSPATAVAKGLLKRLRYVIYELTSLNDSVDLMTPGPGMDTCLYNGYEGKLATWPPGLWRGCAYGGKIKG